YKPVCNKSQRKRTRDKLVLHVMNTSLPMWLADVAVDFDPDDTYFFESKVKPLLLARSKGAGDLKKFRQQVDSLKRFLLNNFPGVVYDVIAQILARVNLSQLTEKEQRFLQLIQTHIDK